ncbi:MAG: hypothetical protein JSU67_07025 [Gammaproteobacteria bacterium]|nr:MAG: hypothetical protein JSU67_07025 [Gammaproteobacteria bacterium]
MTELIRDLIDTSWQAVEQRCEIIGGRRVTRPGFEALTQSRHESRFADDLAVLAHLDAALDLARDYELGHLAAGLSGVRDRIRWSQNPRYDETTVSRELLDGYAYAGLSGPDSPIRCDVPLCGYLIMGPGITYPDHRHAPPEIYLVMTPGSQWCLDSGEWFDVAPGDLIFHDSWQKHATRTSHQPLLAFVAWLERGDRTRIDI